MPHCPYPTERRPESAAGWRSKAWPIRTRRSGAALAAVLLASTAQAKTLDVAAGPDAQERLQTALLDAKPGDVVSLGAGKFDFTDGLSSTSTTSRWPAPVRARPSCPSRARRARARACWSPPTGSPSAT
uniref:Uncharacterized protein n=1 Tax=Phenylobacterium glaciei TaxID=2803784 RepID=A0A974P1J9_9CAUL|nr:hypothetical protein JKL49_19290 [Phenylobacterium glaciei]